MVRYIVPDRTVKGDTKYYSKIVRSLNIDSILVTMFYIHLHLPYVARFGSDQLAWVISG